ncbi:MAG: site-specific integrase [Methanoregula sp.]|nr:site-specific integrase [Methanoregula sp.]
MADKEESSQGKLEVFLGFYQNNSTRIGYSVAVRSFIDSVYGRQRKGYRVSKREKAEYERLVDRYLNETRDYREDLMRYAVYLQGRPPLSARKTFSYVKEFLAAHDIELKSMDLKRIRSKLPKGGPRTIERDMDGKTIQSIIHHMDIKGRALVLVLASSGMRIAEALSVTLDDINLDEKPAPVQIHGDTTKTGENRLTFISTEAVQEVKEWLKVRDRYIKTARHRNKGFVRRGMANPRQPDDRRLFPFSHQTASQMWDTALKKSGFFSRDATTGRKQLHYHMLRKFFISQMSLAVSKEIPEVLAGHAGYLTDAYRRYTRSQLREYYLKAEQMVTILNLPQNNKMDEFRMITMEEQKDIMGLLVKKNARLEADLRELWEEIQRLNQDRYKSLQENPGLPEITALGSGSSFGTGLWKSRNPPRSL